MAATKSANKAAEKAAEDMDIAACNKQLMAEEAAADEAQMASFLQPIQPPPSTPFLPRTSGNTNDNGFEDEDDNLCSNDREDDSGPEDDDILDDASQSAADSSLSIINVDDVSSTQSSKSQRTTPKSSKQCKSSGAKTNRKVTEQMLSSTVLPLAKASKDAMRTKVVYGDVFPPNDVAGRFAYIWGLIKDTAKGNSAFQDALQEASDDEDVKRILMIFVMYGRNAMFNSIVSKAQSTVEAHHKLGGTLDKVKSDVDWLLEDTNFMYGNIDLENQTFNNNKPFGCELIFSIIQSQWFPSPPRSKSDSSTTARLFKDQMLPVSIIILATIAIEHGLKEFSMERQGMFDFTETIAKTSYHTHWNAWKLLENTAQKWTVYWPKHLFKHLMSKSNIQSTVNTCEASAKNIAKVDSRELEKIAEEA
ncbi:hypothetical protein B0H34DRAFT_793001 [Crassisporium funariophilum]|nr:hypothetical protein B0H34DRAFT_793001 [Crassisporium funariophilum]